MRRYLVAYAIWLVSILAVSAVALKWYQHVEEIGLRELADRLNADASDAGE